MAYNTIIYDVKEDIKVALVTLNRPTNFNSITQEMIHEFTEVLKDAEQNDNVRALVLTGSGMAFSAGGDITMLMSATDNIQKKEVIDSGSIIISKILEFTKPTIAAINGVAAGAGTALAMACDIVIAHENAKFTANFVKIAAVPDSGASWFLTRKLGYQKAIELMLTGRLLDAKECYELNIFNKVVPQENFEQEVMKMAAKLAKGPQRVMRYIKQMAKAATENSLNAQFETEASLQMIAFSDSDFTEGISAFLQKRKPEFK